MKPVRLKKKMLTRGRLGLLLNDIGALYSAMDEGVHIPPVAGDTSGAAELWVGNVTVARSRRFGGRPRTIRRLAYMDLAAQMCERLAKELREQIEQEVS